MKIRQESKKNELFLDRKTQFVLGMPSNRKGKLKKSTDLLTATFRS